MRRTSHVLVFHAIVLLAAATAHAQGIARIPATIDQERTAMRGNVHPLAQARFDTGRVAGSLSLERITLFFNRTAAQQAELDDLLVAQQDPSSPQYHKWLTPEQYADRFGVSEADMARVAQWLKAQGFSIVEMARGRQYIAFSGTAAQAEAAFGTELHSFTVRGETHFANVSEPTLPRSLAQVTQGIRGLHDFRPKARGTRMRPKFTSSISGNHFLTPDDFATIYHLKPLYDQGIDGTGQKVGVMGQTNIPLADIATFRSLSGLSANAPTVLPIPGANNSISANDIGEADLDVEWAGAVARKATIIYVNSGTNNGAFDSLTYAIQQNVAPVLTISYGDCEAHWSQIDIDSSTALFKQANLQGQTVVGPSGDTGAADCESPTATTATHGLAVDFPSSSAFVTGVGGTMFNEGATPSQFWSSANNSFSGSALSYMPETVWNETAANNNVLVAGGGGKSTMQVCDPTNPPTNCVPNSKPPWQIPLTPADGVRDVPDISLAGAFLHDGYLICASQQTPADCTNGFRRSDTTLDVIGGTSAGAPTFAGMVALLNQKMGGPQGNVNPLLYGLVVAGSTDAFHDITTGDNKVACTSGTPDCPSGVPIGYPASAGYDLASGLGTVDAYNLISEVSSGTTSTPAAPDFTIGATTATVISVSRGSSGTVTVSFGTMNGFNGNVTVTCVVPSNVTGVTCPQLPMAVAVPPGSPLAVTVAVASNATSASLQKPGASDQQLYLAWSTGGMALAGFMLLAGEGRKRKRSLGRKTLLLGAFLLLLLVLAGCGGSSGTVNPPPPPPPPPSPFAVTMAIQGLSGANVHVVAVTVNVN